MRPILGSFGSYCRTFYLYRFKKKIQHNPNKQAHLITEKIMATKSTRGRPKGSGIDDDKIIAKINKLLAKDPGLKPTTAIKAVGITDASSIRRLRDKLKTDTPTKKAVAKKPSIAAKKPAATRKAAKPAKTPAAKRKAAKPAKTAAATTRKKAAAKKSVPTRTKATAAKKPTVKKPTVKKTVTTRTAAATRAAPKISPPKKTVPTRKAPGKGVPSPTDILNGFGLSNPFGEMTKGMAMPTEMADLNIENIVSTTVEKQIQLYESALKLSPMANILRQQALLTDMILTVLRTQKEFSKSMNVKG